MRRRRGSTDWRGASDERAPAEGGAVGEDEQGRWSTDGRGFVDEGEQAKATREHAVLTGGRRGKELGRPPARRGCRAAAVLERLGAAVELWRRSGSAAGTVGSVKSRSVD